MAKSLNANFHKANKAKNDEFYTELIDIEKELKHTKNNFLDKVVYCNVMIHLKVIFSNILPQILMP